MTRIPIKTSHLRRAIEVQRARIKEHGGSLAGYVARHGSKDDPEHIRGFGGETIYAADVERLTALQRALTLRELRAQERLDADIRKPTRRSACD